MRRGETGHIDFENHHNPIVDYRTFAIAQEQFKNALPSITVA